MIRGIIQRRRTPLLNAPSIPGLTRPHGGHGPLHMFKTEFIKQIGHWKSMREVEWEMLKWVDWQNNRRLLGPIGYTTPTEAEEAFHSF